MTKPLWDSFFCHPENGRKGTEELEGERKVINRGAGEKKMNDRNTNMPQSGFISDP